MFIPAFLQSFTRLANLYIPNLFNAGKSISPLIALNKFGIYRLAARCFDLRNDPVNPLNIQSIMIFEHPIKYAKYNIPKPKRK